MGLDPLPPARYVASDLLDGAIAWLAELNEGFASRIVLKQDW